MSKEVVSVKIDPDVKARLIRLTQENGMSVNQFLGELVVKCLNDHDEGFKKAQTTIAKIDEKVREAVCPICNSPLEYAKGWFSDEIRCSFGECDTRRKGSLQKEMGEREYLCLLNIRRREAYSKALDKEEKKKSASWWEELNDDLEDILE